MPKASKSKDVDKWSPDDAEDDTGSSAIDAGYVRPATRKQKNQINHEGMEEEEKGDEEQGEEKEEKEEEGEEEKKRKLSKIL